nr:MAG TPA: serine protease [Caudoviricetes sp.]
METSIKGRIAVQKSDDEKRLVFGWASVAQEESGNTLVDLAGDVIEPEVLEQAAYDFVRLYREGGEMHERGGCATLVESCVFTQDKKAALGIPDDALPVGWWIGFKVTDDEVWEKVKSGEYPMFSIEGTAVREPDLEE